MATKRPFQFSLSMLLLAVTGTAVCLAIPQLGALIVAAAACFAIVLAPIVLIRGLSDDDREEKRS
jgi:hypothetical protein